MKRTPSLKRKTPLTSKVGIKCHSPLKTRSQSRTGAKRPKKTPVQTLSKACDTLLTPIIKLLHPRCLLCGNETQVAHHHVHKSKSLRLRYELDNLIPLCNHCHIVLHHNESYWASKVVEIKGMRWFKKIDRVKNEVVKADRFFYEQHLARLKDIHANIQ